MNKLNECWGVQLEQLEIIPKVKQLCIEGKYDEAIALTDYIEDKTIAIKAHLLCIEHEEANRRKNELDL